MNVLLVEDNPGDARLVREMLVEPGPDVFDLSHTDRVGSALERLDASGIDVVLLDLSLPDAQGIDTLTRIQNADSTVPIVILSGHSDEDMALRAVQNGAQDYLVKGSIGGEMLSRSIRYAIERKRMELHLAKMAQYDQLTGLANRKMFREDLEKALARARRNESGLALLFLDLDRFKTINDTLGHRIGDLLLQATAQRLKSCLRKTDSIARLGGDEFTIITEASLSVIAEGVAARRNAAIVAKKLIAVMEQPFQIEEHEVYVGTSIGIACTSGDTGRAFDGDTLVMQADMAMYRAKEMGGGTFEFHTSEMTEHANKRLDLENKIRSGIENDEFVLHYQPLIDLPTRRVIGVEALVRWKQPPAYLVAPNEFIPVAEESGLIVRLGEWVLRAACAQHRRWMDTELPPMRLAVNISARQFQDRGFVGLVREVLASENLDPQHLELEITEGLLAGNSTEATETMRALKLIGVRLAIDDFGTGYSSLAYLKEFPVDALKIDRSFISGVLTNNLDAAIATTVIELAHNLGLDVTAEGVEDEAQMAWLNDRACDAVQGFLICKPLPADTLTGWLDAESSHNAAANGSSKDPPGRSHAGP